MSEERKHKGAVVYSVALHVALVAALTMSVHLPSLQREAGTEAPIQATMVDSSALEKREQAVREEQQRQQREEKQQREAEQKVQRERDETVKREQELKLKQAQELKDKQTRELKAREDAAKRDQEQKAKQAQELKDRQAQDLKDKQARDQKTREDAVKRKQQQQADDDLQRQLAAEEDGRQAARSGLLDQYVRMIQDKIERNWTRPLSAASGLDCIVSVTQAITGDVLDVHLASCNGDDAVRRSIEAAVRLASPLPKPPNPNLFERNLNVRFRPEI
ncbi:MAG: cell envelope integrity protein TolA [Gammaproteobacteria bacterium]